MDLFLFSLATMSDCVTLPDLEIHLAPHQPAAGSFSFPLTAFSKQKRAFSPTWFPQRPWLHYCRSLDAAFCFPCSKAQALKVHISRGDNPFVFGGFRNWSKSERLSEHGNSESHRTAVSKLQAYTSQPSIDVQLNTQKIQEQVVASRCLDVIVSSVLFLGRQGLALHGEDDNDEGNFLQLLQLRATDVPELTAWLAKKRSYTSHEIQNEILEIAALMIQESLAARIHKAGYFGLMSDETTDVSTQEQVSISVRIVEELEPVELFLGFHSTTTTTGEAIANILLDVLCRLRIPIERCRAQTYDGASNMSGCFRGAQAIIALKEARARFVHCSNHVLNLCLQDAAKSSIVIRDALEVAHEIGKLFKESPKRLALLAQMATDAGAEVISVKPLCETRWTVRQAALNSIVKQYSLLKDTLEDIGVSQSFKGTLAGAKASGLADKLGKTTTLFGLYVAQAVFGICEDLARALQSSTATHSSTANAVKLVLGKLKEHCDSDYLSGQFDRAKEKEESWGLTEPAPRRHRVPSAKARELGVPEILRMNTRERSVAQAKEAVEAVIDELNVRFCGEGFQLVSKVEDLLVKATNKVVDHTMACEVVIMLGDDLDLDVFERHLHNLSAICGPRKSIDEIRKFLQTLHPTSQDLVSEVVKLVTIVTCIATSTAGSERSFSALRRLKTWLRSSMTQKRLTHVALLAVYHEDVDKLSVQEVKKRFVLAKSGRKEIFG